MFKDNNFSFSYKIKIILNTKPFALVAVFLFLFGLQSQAQSVLSNHSKVYEEKNGLVAVEAEDFYKQTNIELRQWYRTSKNETPNVGRDEDLVHFETASNKQYIEILPDERVTHSDKLEKGKNFTDEAGKMAVVHYKVKINTPGRYYVWVRAFSTGSEDNGVHVGIDNQWPANGKRMQWCTGKGTWTWESKQRTKDAHCGLPYEIYLDIDKAAVHDIAFSMREDGFEMDKFILTTDKNYIPTGQGPEATLLATKNTEQKSLETLKTYFNTIATASIKNRYISSQEFPIEGTGFYKNGKNWLAINPEKNKEAQSSLNFDFKSGNYDLIFVGVGENDGASTFTVLINDIELGTYSPPLSSKMWEEGTSFNGLWRNVKINKGDKITVLAKVGSDGVEWTRGRWAGIVFTPAGKGKKIQHSSN